MQTHWIKREGEDELLLFVLGWGADPHAVEHIRPDGYDSLAVFDYRVREPLSSSLNSEYGRIHLFAWSFGVWAAEQIATELDLYQAVALNGTPLPINDRYGIPERAFSVTLRGIPRSGCEGFNLRAYGDSFRRLAPYLDERPFEERCEELAVLGESARKPYRSAIRWSAAVIGTRDEIFPPRNMAAYWQQTGRCEDLPHYPFADPQTVIRFLNPEKTHHENR